MAKKSKKFPARSAYVACNGGSRAHGCHYGCMSCGACIEACKKEAIFYNEWGVARVDEARCIGCGLCIKACPQDIIHIHMKDNPFLVLCSNEDKGAQAKKMCEASCIGCGLCRKNCPSEAVDVPGSCAIIEDEKCLVCGNCVIKCPRGVITDTRGIIR